MYQTGPSPAALLAEPMLVINQKLKLIELRNEFRIFDQHGNQIGVAVQARQSPLAFLARIFSDLDVALPMTLEVRDRAGGIALTLHKPWFRMVCSVTRGDGLELARVNKKWAGLRELFTDADNYVIQLNPAAPDPMRGMAVASVLAIDTVMKQKDTG